MNLRRTEEFDALLLEFELCTQQHSKHNNKGSDIFMYSQSHAISVFTRLLLRDKPCFNPNSNSGKTVCKVLKEKQPNAWHS